MRGRLFLKSDIRRLIHHPRSPKRFYVTLNKVGPNLKNLNAGFELVDYIPPTWTKGLDFTPCKKLQLCQVPTPIHEFKVPGLPKDVEMYIKRDDMTGGIIGGNKYRKLEFFLADAVNKGYDTVVTGGTYSSSHCMATSVAAKMIGLDCYIVIQRIKGYSKTIERVCKAPGLYLPTFLCCTKIYQDDRPVDVNITVDKYIEQEIIQKIEKEAGKMIYDIPYGGSYSSISLYAYIDVWEEMTSQGLHKRFDDVIVVLGSGGSAVGLAIGNYLTGSKLKVHGVTVLQSSADMYKDAQQELRDIGLHVKAQDILNIIDIHDFLGYEINREEDYEFIADVSAETGVLCDRVYVGKALKELVYLLNNHPQQFQGNRILFIHTGGMIGQYDGEMENTLKKLHSLKCTNLNLI